MAYLERQLSARGIRAVDLARALDVAPQVVTNWKTRGIPISRFREVASVLDVPVEDLEQAYQGKLMARPIHTEVKEAVELIRGMSPDVQKIAVELIRDLAKLKS